MPYPLRNRFQYYWMRIGAFFGTRPVVLTKHIEDRELIVGYYINSAGQYRIVCHNIKVKSSNPMENAYYYMQKLMPVIDALPSSVRHSSTGMMK